MPPSLDLDRRLSEATPPHTKKRKIAVMGNFSAQRASATPLRAPHSPNASRFSTVGPSRMVATPVHPSSREQQQAQTIRPIMVHQRPSPVRSMPSVSKVKARTPYPNARGGAAAGAHARMTTKSAKTRELREEAPLMKRTQRDISVAGSQWSDPESEGSDEFISRPLVNLIPTGDHIPPRGPPRGQRRARKTFSQIAAKSGRRSLAPQRLPDDFVDNVGIANDDDDDDDLYVDADPDWLAEHAREQDKDVDRATLPAEFEPIQTVDPEQELMESLNVLTLCGTAINAADRLPFLRRNLRNSLDILGARKAKKTIFQFLMNPPPKVQVVYMVGQKSFNGYSIHGWRCPLCRILRTVRFKTRAGLEIHLEQFHTRSEFEWDEDGGQNGALLLKITVPEVPASDSESDTDGEGQLSSSDLNEEEEVAADSLTRLSPLKRSPTPELKPFLRGSSVFGGRSVFAPSPFKPPRSSPELSSFRSSAGTPRPPVSRLSSAAAAEVQRPPRPIDQANPARYPTPPPYVDLEGPAAVYPYISGSSYSARPGGPKLYDLLNELPLEPFGLMAWYVVDKEEDIFELDNVRDEDKVMRALWGRWIMLNRNTFIADYEKGVKMFIDEYWRIIHRAAGFSALRIWLLTLAQNRFLTGTQFCDVLKYYSDLVGMDLWK